MLVAASTACFPDLSLCDALDRLIDLEYTSVEIDVSEQGHLKPSLIMSDFEQAIQLCRQSRRLTPTAFYFDSDAPRQEYFEQFTACCKLAKALKVVTVAVRSSELGTPFNEEVERLRDLVTIATGEGVVVGVATESGRMTQDPDSTDILCRTIKGLAVTLDPSHFIYGGRQNVDYDGLIPYVCHVRLRDSREDKLQVSVGQGLVEYGRVVTQLFKSGYTRALCVDVHPMSNVDQNSELRKMRLLLESLL